MWVIKPFPFIFVPLFLNIFIVIKKSDTIWNTVNFRRCLCFYGLIKPMIEFVIGCLWLFLFPFNFSSHKFFALSMTPKNCSGVLFHLLVVVLFFVGVWVSYIITTWRCLLLFWERLMITTCKPKNCFVLFFYPFWRILTSTVQQQLPSVLKLNELKMIYWAWSWKLEICCIRL